MKNLVNILKALWKTACNPYYGQEIKGKNETVAHSNGIDFIKAYHGFLSGLKYDYVIGCTYFLPKKVLKRFLDEKLIIKVTTIKEVREVSNNENAVAFFCKDSTDLERKIIFIGAQLSFFELKRVLYHEIGHFIDRCVFEDSIASKITNDLEFQSQQDDILKNAFYKEKNICERDYHKSNITEYFAEAFSKIVSKNKIFTENAPITTTMVLNYIQSL